MSVARSRYYGVWPYNRVQLSQFGAVHWVRQNAMGDVFTYCDLPVTEQALPATYDPTACAACQEAARRFAVRIAAAVEADA